MVLFKVKNPLKNDEIEIVYHSFIPLKPTSKLVRVRTVACKTIIQYVAFICLPFSRGDLVFFLFHEHGASLLAFMNSPKSC